MPEFSPQTKQLISRYQSWHKSLEPKEGISTIHVDEIASRVASFYEKIRQIVDWKEEHLLRRGAIMRNLKRRFLEFNLETEENLSKKIAEPLILELIRSGHFPNDKIESRKVFSVQKILDKYIFILKNNPPLNSPRKKLQFYNWILEIAACEIEEEITPLKQEIILMDYMFERMKERINMPKKITEEEKNIQIFIAVREALFKLDSPIISYQLLNYKYAQWKNPSQEFLNETAKNIYNIWSEIEQNLSHPLGKKIYAICEKYDTPYLILGDILSNEKPDSAAKKISNPEVLENLIRESYKKRFLTLKKRLSRAAFYYTLSVLLTNIISVIILEIPLAKLIYGSFSRNPFLTISVDILAPTFLMLIFIVTIKPPKESNLNFVIMETMKIVYKKEKTDNYKIEISKKKGVITKFILALFYALGAFVSFGIIFGIFYLASFPFTSIVINIVFVALIVFGGMIIRQRSKELTVEEKPSGFLEFFFDIITLPLADFGRWISKKWKKYNAIAYFFDALIDLPFSVFVEFLENWRFFLKEKKEEIH